jgi:hypothetical protein
VKEGLSMNDLKKEIEILEEKLDNCTIKVIDPNVIQLPV